MHLESDPIGQAILDFEKKNQPKNIFVYSDICDDDILPVSYLFRTFEDMPDIEKTALSLSSGRVLDVGAGTGCHSVELQKKGCEVFAIDVSPGAVDYMKRQGLNATVDTIFTIQNNNFDTILLLMNGIGLAGTVDKLTEFLIQLKSKLKLEGKILCESTDLTYLYAEDDGSVWIDLNAKYRGEVKFKMKFGEAESNWFDWLYIEFDLLKHHAELAGLNCTLVYAGENQNYLACLEYLKK